MTVEWTKRPSRRETTVTFARTWKAKGTSVRVEEHKSKYGLTLRYHVMDDFRTVVYARTKKAAFRKANRYVRTGRVN